VPKLKGKKLAAAKRSLWAADCRPGTVARRKGASAKAGKVVGQSKKPGTVASPDSSIKLTLGRR
jgi:beta-lactam-binding protein with PASTA domain